MSTNRYFLNDSFDATQMTQLINVAPFLVFPSSQKLWSFCGHQTYFPNSICGGQQTDLSAVLKFNFEKKGFRLRGTLQKNRPKTSPSYWPSFAPRLKKAPRLEKKNFAAIIDNVCTFGLFVIFWMPKRGRLSSPESGWVAKMTLAPNGKTYLLLKLGTLRLKDVL